MENNTDKKKTEIKKYLVTGIDKDFVDFAQNKSNDISTSNSQLMNIYGELVRIKSIGFINNKTAFWVLKPQVAYKTANDKKLAVVKDLFDSCWDVIAELDKDSENNNSSKSQKAFDNMCKLFEAILAFCKYNVNQKKDKINDTNSEKN